MMEGMDGEFDERIERRGSCSLKWDIYKGRDVLPFWVAEMDFRSPAPVIEALRKCVERGVFGYAWGGGGPEEAVIGYFRRRHGLEIQKSWIVWLPGLVPALSAVSRCAGGPGDAVMTATPVYPPFLKAPADGGLECLRVPLVREGAAGRWTFDFPAMEHAVLEHGRVRLFLLCHPHNPVGRVFDAGELAALTDFCRRHGLLLCSDEIHCDLVYDENETPFHSLLGSVDAIGDRLILLGAASKTYNVAGLGCAYAVIPEGRLRAAFQRAMGKWVAPPTLPGLTALEAAYEHGEEWRLRLMEYLASNRAVVERFVATEAPALATGKIEATFLAWMDGRIGGWDDPAGVLLKHGLGVSNGRDFGAPGFFRLNFGCPRSMLEEGLDRLRTALAGEGMRV